MSSTIIGVNDPKAVKRWSSVLFVDNARESYYGNRLVGTGADAQTPFVALTDLESKAGDTISYDLNLQLRGRPVYGDGRITGTEEALRHATDTIKIDLVAKSVSAGRTMSQKRTLHNLRTTAKDRQRDFWGRWNDEMCSMYLSGSRGVNADFIEGEYFTGYAGNALYAPDADHLLFGGTATAYNDIDTADGFDLRLIDRAVTKSAVMGGGATNIPRIRPMKINGEDRFVCIMHPYQWHATKVNTSTGQWLDIQKAAAGAVGNSSPIFRGSEGMYNGVVIHKHNTVIKFDDAGVGLNVPAARALFLGRQAGAIAYGTPGDGMRLKWREDVEDRGRELVVTVDTCSGHKKTRFTVDGTARDFGVLALDTYAVNPG